MRIDTRPLTSLLFVALLFGSATAAIAQNQSPVPVDDDYAIRAGSVLNVASPGVLQNDYDPNGDAIEAVSFSDPASGSVSLNSNGELEYTPDPGFSGNDAFTYTIRDSNGSLSQQGTVTVHVKAANRAPLPTPDTYVARENETLSISVDQGVLKNDTDPDGDAISAVNYSNPTNGTVSFVSSGSFEYTPDTGFSGSDSFQYRIEDSNGAVSSFTTIDITVVANDDPVVTDDAYAVMEGQSLNVSAPGVLANDYDPNGDTFDGANVGDASHGTRTLYTSGELTYTPDPGFTGTDEIQYRNRDDRSAYSSFGSITITVIPSNQSRPEAVADHYVTREGETLSVNAPGLLDNDVNVTGTSLIVSNVSTPANGSVNVVTDGSFTYDPDAGFVGTDSFTYYIRDDNGNTHSVTSYVTVRENRPPEVIDDSYVIFEDSTLTVDAPGALFNDFDRDGDAFTGANVSAPSNGTRTFYTSGQMEYTPDPGFTGTDIFQYRNRDEHGAYSSFGTISITVKPDPNRAPETIVDRYHVFQDRTLVVDAPGVLSNDFDADRDDFSGANVSDAQNGTRTLYTSGKLEYTPDPGFTGVDEISYRIDDEHGVYSGFATIEIHVTSDAVLPVELADFHVALDDETAVVTWRTLSEKNNAGFHVQRRIGESGGFENVEYINGAGTVTQPKDYRYEDALPFDAETVTYRLEQIDLDGTKTLSDEVRVERHPNTFDMQAIGPNPVRDRATVYYTLPKTADVRLEVYDLLGRRVALIVDGEQSPGRKKATIDASRLSSGMHVVVLSADGDTKTRKISVVH